LVIGLHGWLLISRTVDEVFFIDAHYPSVIIIKQGTKTARAGIYV